MKRLTMTATFGIGSPGHPDRLHRSDLSGEVLRKAASMGLWRVAGNAFICESSKDFWKIRGNKIVRLVGDEVDNGDSLAAAPEDNPSGFLDDILGDLTF